MSKISKSNDLNTFTIGIIGGLSGVTAESFTFPINFCKVRLQMNGEGGSPV